MNLVFRRRFVLSKISHTVKILIDQTLNVQYVHTCLLFTLIFKSWFCFPSRDTNSHCWGLLVTGGMGLLYSLSPLVLLCLLCLRARADVRVETHSGWVRGAVKQFHCQDGSGQYFSFKGIPYAKPPVGDLVWRDPEPVDNWDGEVWRWHCVIINLVTLIFRLMAQLRLRVCACSLGDLLLLHP